MELPRAERALAARLPAGRPWSGAVVERRRAVETQCLTLTVVVDAHKVVETSRKKNGVLFSILSRY